MAFFKRLGTIILFVLIALLTINILDSINNKNTNVNENINIMVLSNNETDLKLIKINQDNQSIKIINIPLTKKMYITCLNSTKEIKYSLNDNDYSCLKQSIERYYNLPYIEYIVYKNKIDIYKYIKERKEDSKFIRFKNILLMYFKTKNSLTLKYLIMIIDDSLYSYSLYK